MNNPALPMYASQNPGPYAFSNPQAVDLFSISPGPPFDTAQAPFQPGMIPNHMQRPSLPQQAQHPTPQPFYQQHPGQVAAYSPHQFQDKGHPSNGRSPVPLTPGGNQTFNLPRAQIPTSTPHALPASSVSTDMNMAVNMALPAQPNASLAQQAQIQNAAQVARTAPQQQQAAGGQALSPQSAARERARVSILLEINAHLLQEVVSLQAQGKAGSNSNQGQQSPTSPTSVIDATASLNNSPGEPPKSSSGTGSTPSKPPSQEYADCMRRLQANLAYLAAIADAKKKANGALPTGPAIMIPPPHLAQVQGLYKKLNSLFPEAGHSVVNKAMAYAAAQSQNPTTAAKSQQGVALSTQG